MIFRKKKKPEPFALDAGEWRCSTCGKWHRGLPLDYAFDYPETYLGLTDEERSRAFINSDLCAIEAHKWFFIRGVIEIRILGTDRTFMYGVWSSLSEKNYRFVVDHGKGRELEEVPPMFGWLNSRISIYPETFNLKTNVHLRSGGIRPSIELEPTDHPLAVEQRSGITVERVQQIVAQIMHTSS